MSVATWVLLRSEVNPFQSRIDNRRCAFTFLFIFYPTIIPFLWLLNRYIRDEDALGYSKSRESWRKCGSGEGTKFCIGGGTGLELLFHKLRIFGFGSRSPPWPSAVEGVLIEHMFRPLTGRPSSQIDFVLFIWEEFPLSIPFLSLYFDPFEEPVTIASSEGLFSKPSLWIVEFG